jgi:hypothetical protein
LRATENLKKQYVDFKSDTRLTKIMHRKGRQPPGLGVDKRQQELTRPVVWFFDAYGVGHGFGASAPLNANGI